MPRIRLDQLLVVRALVPSRERARALILAGDVLVSGAPSTKAGTLIDEDAEITLRVPDHPYVGRGGIKLAGALDAFGIQAAGVLALDIGASTGGFTDVLLQRGARHVVAVDVGHHQLAWKLRQDPRVTCLEGVNARHLTADALPADMRRFDLVTIDVSFISLRHILPVVPPLLEPAGRLVTLIKPQFEAGRHDVGPGGIVRDETVHARVIADVTSAAAAVGLERIGLDPSPIEGAEGNREFLACFRDSAIEPRNP
jgi:23S rRNA (cytidine1920-2'-O)/16S rRNA (cytidine1409-2'-O)-methyltransferase